MLVSLPSSISFLPRSAGTDFEAGTRSVTITSGMTQACIDIPIEDDEIGREPGKDFMVTFDPPGGTTGTTMMITVTIVDDDGKVSSKFT